MGVVTNGGAAGTDGGPAKSAGEGKYRFPPLIWALYGIGLAVIGLVIGSSYWMEADRMGANPSVWPIAAAEITSLSVIFGLTPLLFRWAAWLDPARIGWPRALLGHGLGALIFSGAHIGGMVALRHALYGAFGHTYNYGPFFLQTIYELRKDVLTYAGILLLGTMVDQLLRRRAETHAPALAADRRIEIRDGARRVWLSPAEILWVEAAGNYVELRTPERAWLLRRTLSAIEAELAAEGFARIHRSRLVNRRHVRSLQGNDNGDFTLTLSNGAAIAGSRRFRAGLGAL